MVDVIHYQNEAFEKTVEPKITEFYNEACQLLPVLPEMIKIYFSSDGIIPETGEGGYAYAPDIIALSLSLDFEDKNLQMQNLRGTVFHESFHIAQNFTGQSGPFSALEVTVYEGAATVFEREKAGVNPPWGKYSDVPDSQLYKWFEELRKLGEEYQQEAVYTKWKFYHPDYKERWILYRTGAWLIDQALRKNNLSILDLQNKNAHDIVALL